MLFWDFYVTPLFKEKRVCLHLQCISIFPYINLYYFDFPFEPVPSSALGPHII